MTEVSMRKGRGRPKRANEIDTFEVSGIDEMVADMQGLIELIDNAIKKRVVCPNCKREVIIRDTTDLLMLAGKKSMLLKTMMAFARDAAMTKRELWNAEQCRRAMSGVVRAVVKGMDPVDVVRRQSRGETMDEIVDEFRRGVVEAVKVELVNITEAEIVGDEI